MYNKNILSRLSPLVIMTMLIIPVLCITGCVSMYSNLFRSLEDLEHVLSRKKNTDTFYYNGFKYKTHKNTCSIENYYGEEKDVVIPKRIKGKKVIAINSYAFFKKGITSVAIPNSVDYIGGSSFANNQLASVIIPDSVDHIGIAAFDNNQLASVIIPNNVEEIGMYAFANNQLISVNIPKNVKRIGTGLFLNNPIIDITMSSDNNNFLLKDGVIFSKDGKILKYCLISKENYVIPDSVTEIGNSAFNKNQLTSIIIPDNVTKIDQYAFKNNQLSDLIIPDSVTEICIESFINNQLTSLIIPDNVRIEAKAFRGNPLTSVTFNYLSYYAIAKDAFDSNIDFWTFYYANDKKKGVYTIQNGICYFNGELILNQYEKLLKIATDAFKNKEYTVSINQYRSMLIAYPNDNVIKNNLKIAWDSRITENSKLYPAPFSGKWEYYRPYQMAEWHKEIYYVDEYDYTISRRYDTGVNTIIKTHRRVPKTREILGASTPALRIVYEFTGKDYTITNNGNKKSGTFYYNNNEIELDDGTILMFFKDIMTTDDLIFNKL